MIDLKHLTFGAEYEFGDIITSGLPKGLSWNGKDYSIVSSTGIANDPKRQLYTKGGEINSKPTDTVDEQLAMFEELLAMHPEAQVNHRTNLHLHVRVPGLSEDLESLKKLLAYVHRTQAQVYEAIEQIPEPKEDEFPSKEEYKGALKRFRRRKVSHQYAVPRERVEKALNAETVEGFLSAHAPVDSKGNPAWGLTTRAGINLLQLKETDTIEFRHFTCTKDIKELASCFVWINKYIQGAFEGATVNQLLSTYTFQFPPFMPYNHDMEVGYQYTNFDKNSRKVVKERLGSLAEHLNLYTCKAEEVVKCIRENSL